MRRLGLCLVVSLIVHAAFFPQLVQSMLSSSSGSEVAVAPVRKVRLQLVSKPKPIPKEVARPARERARPRPRPAVTRPSSPRQVTRAPSPESVPRKAERRPDRPRAAAAAPARTSSPQPSGHPRPAPAAAAPRRPSTDRLSRVDVTQARSTQSQPRSSSEPRSQRAGVVPDSDNGISNPAEARPDEGVSDPGTTSHSADSSGGEGSGQPPLSGPEPGPAAAKIPEPENGPERQPQPERSPEPDKKPTPQPSRSGAGPKAREATISVPSTIKLPASLRRDTVNLSLQVRVVVNPDGSADFRLGDSSGNSQADDFVLDQLRKVASVSPALDNEGVPKRSMKRVTVKIEVE